MPRNNNERQRAELARKIRRDMRRRNRRIVIIVFFVALVLGLALGIWMSSSKFGISLPTIQPANNTQLTPEGWTIPPDAMPDAMKDKEMSTPEATQEVPAPPVEDSTPEPIPEVTQQPTPKPIPETTAEPTPEPTLEPTPEPTLEPTPEPTPEPTVEPDPLEQSTPDMKKVVEEQLTPQDTQTAVEEPTPVPQQTPTAEDQVVQVFVVYKKGDRNDEVKKIQELLVQGGYLTEKPDGIFGKNTEAALRVYQKEQGLEENGTADENTQKKLFGITDTPPVELVKPQGTQPPVKNVTVAMGEKQEVPDLCTFTIDQFRFDYIVEASNAPEDMPHAFYESSNTDMTYLYLTGTITNTSKKAIMPNIFDFSVYTGSLQEYSGFAAFEDNQGKDLKAYASLEPGSTAPWMLIVEVPVSLTGSDEPIVGTATIGNMIFQIPLR